MFEGPVYTAFSPSLYLSYLWWKSWGLRRQNMFFSSSSPEEREISLEMRQRQGVVVLNSAHLVGMNPVALSMGQAFNRILAATSPSCGSFPFSACYVVCYTLHSVANALLHHVLHGQDLYLSRSNIYALQAWGSCPTSHWPACGKPSWEKCLRLASKPQSFGPRWGRRWTLAPQYCSRRGIREGVCFPSSDLVGRFHPLQPGRYLSKAWQEPALLWSSHRFLLQAISLLMQLGAGTSKRGRGKKVCLSQEWPLELTAKQYEREACLVLLDRQSGDLIDHVLAL